jgi:hypothetical protein
MNISSTIFFIASAFPEQPKCYSRLLYTYSSLHLLIGIKIWVFNSVLAKSQSIVMFAMIL